MNLKKLNNGISSIAHETKLIVEKGSVFVSECTLDVHGYIKGNIKEIYKNRTQRKIDGNLNCDTLEIYGEFTGNGEVRELQVCKGGKVKGSLSYNTIVVEVGAIISGPMKPIDKDPVLLIGNKLPAEIHNASINFGLLSAGQQYNLKKLLTAFHQIYGKSKHL